MYGGEEVYFYVSVSAKLENDAKDVISFGEIAFWSTGKAIAIGFGKTPLSVGDEIRLADKCNVWGKTNFNLKKLKNINPGCEVLVENIDNKFMDNAINLALKSFQLNEVPVGCIIVDANNKIVGYGYNSSIKNHDPTSHAEIMAIRMACKKKS